MAGELVGRSATWARGHEGHPTYVAGEVLDESATWALNYESHPAYVAGESGARDNSWAHSNGTVQATAVGVNPRSEVQSQPTLTAEVNDWLRAARAPIISSPVGPKPEATETLDEAEYRSLNAF